LDAGAENDRLALVFTVSKIAAKPSSELGMIGRHSPVRVIHGEDE
jgi:hypothetical protein